MGGGTTSKVEASSSGAHSATHCQYVDEYTCTDWYTEECGGGPTSTEEEDIGDCEECGGIYWYEYGVTCDNCGSLIELTYVFPACGCGNHESKPDEPDYYDHYDVDYPCDHGYTSDHDQVDYYNCSSSHKCQNGHSSYRTTDHYYCTTHNYVGTSSTCPGLTVNPSPSTIQLHVGQSQRITPNQQPSSASVSYTSNNTSTATVSSTGTVTGKRKGSTTIRVTASL